MSTKLPNHPKFWFLIPNPEKGQVLIVLLLVILVVLTIGLSVVTKTLTDVRISTQSELSQKAFSAAEAGIEDALRQDLQFFQGRANVPFGDVNYTVEVTKSAAGSSFTPERPVEKDDVVQLNLAGTGASSLYVYWVNTDSVAGQLSPKASIEVTEIYQDSAGYKIEKSAANPSCTTVSDFGETNGFSSSNCATGGNFVPAGSQINYFARLKVPLHSNPQALRLRPFYNLTSVAVQVAEPVGALLPEQTFTITSTGTTGSISRKIQVTRSVNALPPIFDYVLYSGQDITK